MAKHLRVGTALAFGATVVMHGAACALPGQTLGTYDVRGELQEDTCGGAPNPWSFRVMLSKTGDTLYWSWLDARPMLSGTVGADGQATLTGYEVANVDGTQSSAGPCNLERSDDLAVTLGEGASPTKLEATLTYSFSVQTGATCTDQLATSGGMYDVLPCTMRYTLSGERE